MQMSPFETHTALPTPVSSSSKTPLPGLGPGATLAGLDRPATPIIPAAPPAITTGGSLCIPTCSQTLALPRGASMGECGDTGDRGETISFWWPCCAVWWAGDTAGCSSAKGLPTSEYTVRVSTLGLVLTGKRPLRLPLPVVGAVCRDWPRVRDFASARVGGTSFGGGGVKVRGDVGTGGSYSQALSSLLLLLLLLFALPLLWYTDPLP